MRGTRATGSGTRGAARSSNPQTHPPQRKGHAVPAEDGTIAHHHVPRPRGARHGRRLLGVAAGALLLVLAAACSGNGSAPSTATATVPATGTATTGSPTATSPTATATTAGSATATGTAGATGTATACLNDEPIGTAPDTGNASPLSSVIFVDDTHGWVVGAGRIVATTDGGAHWTQQYQGSAQLQQVWFADAAHGWALGSRRLLTTSDSGDCWQELPMPSTPLREIEFLSPTEGWGIERAADQSSKNAGELVRTKDGGRTWQAVDAPETPQSVCFTDYQRGWLMGGSGVVYRSIDNGGTWTKAFTPTSEALGGELQCAGPRDVWVLALGGGAAGHIGYWLYHGADGGDFVPVLCNTFFPDCPGDIGHSLPDLGSYPGPLSSVSAEKAVFFTYTPPLAKPSTSLVLVDNEGALVSKPSAVIPGFAEQTSAAFRTEDHGWVAGRTFDNHWQIVTTTDGGKTWSTQLDFAGQ